MLPTVRKPSLWRRVRANGVLHAVAARIVPPRVHDHRRLLALLEGSRGIEIGGPSRVFSPRGIFPVYSVVSDLDNVNFSTATVWEGNIADGAPYRFRSDRPPGRQFVLEATDLASIPSGIYDFLLSSHTLEHVANPLKALAEWRRVVRPGGLLVIVIPNKSQTFDHRRPVTPMRHLASDEANDTGEDDQTHIEEVMQLHDASRDPGWVGWDVPLAEHNFTTRVMHHHVFDPPLVSELLAYMNLELFATDVVWPCHIFALARNGLLTAGDGRIPSQPPIV